MVTGATGFIGSALEKRLAKEENTSAHLALRQAPQQPPAHLYTVVGDLAPDNDWREALQGCDAVVHCAARVHVMNEDAADPLAEFRRTNVEGTLNLARQALESGIKRFIFMSSIKVNGEQTFADNAFAADDEPTPTDPYGISKHEAEQGLLALTETTGMEVVIIRPPLVYGPGVKGNFLSMLRWLHKGVPLPLGAIHNKRSMVARANLVDFIVTCLNHPAAANQVFLAGDGEDLATTELLRRLGQAIGKPARLLPVPMKLLEASAGMVGKQAIAQRLCGNLRVDIRKAQKLLGWRPPVSVDEALNETAKAYLNSQNPSRVKEPSR